METTKIQVHLLDCHTLRFHSHSSVSLRHVLGVRRSAPQPLQRLLAPPEDEVARRRRHPHAHPPGLPLYSILIYVYIIGEYFCILLFSILFCIVGTILPLDHKDFEI